MTIWNKVKSWANWIFPCYGYAPVVFALLVNLLTYNGSRFLTTGRYHFNIMSPLDEIIPLVPAFLIVYIGAFATWTAGWIIISRESRESAYGNFTAETVAKVICLVIFLVFPTTMLRPAITEEGFLHEMTELLYNMDAADNLFPSIHCLESWFVARGVQKCARVGKGVKVFFWVCAILVFLSVVFVRQHVVADIVGGVLAMEAGFLISGKLRLQRFWYAIEERFQQKLAARKEKKAADKAETDRDADGDPKQ